MQKKSIAFITNAYPDFDSSCRGIFIKHMIIFLQSVGYEISVVTPKIFKLSHYFEEQNGIRIYRFPFFSGNRLLIEYEKVPYLRMLLYYTTGLLLGIFVVLRHRCCLIHAHWAIPTGLIGVWIGSLLRRPLVVTIHGSDYRLAMGNSLILRRLFLHVCRKAKHIICVSEVLRKEIEQLGIEGRKISTFPMGVDETFLESWSERGAYSKDQCFTILSNRKFLPIYNVSLLIRAIPIVLREEPNVRFLIAGDGPEREKLERQAKNLNINSSIQFLGWVRHEEMATLLSQAEIYVSTSLDDGTSVSLLEAMASGTFPIVTNIPSNREWISDGENGFLIPTENEAMLAKKLVEAIRNRRLLGEASIKNRKIIEQKAYWRENIKKIKELYQNSL